jgi:SAM-dependent methyltransferase
MSAAAMALYRPHWRSRASRPSWWSRARLATNEAINATLDQADLTTGTVPAIGLFDVVEHIEDSLAFLKEAHRMLAPGGRVYIAVPAHEWLWSGEDDYARHFRRYTARSLTAELRGAGFDVENTTYMFSFLVLPIWLLRRLPYQLGFARPFSPEGVKSDHAAAGAGAVLTFLRAAELLLLGALGRVPFGTSVVAIAHKPRPSGGR